MLTRLQDLIVRASRTWWLYLLVVVVFVGSLNALLQIGAAFPAHAAGAQPFDLQNNLTAGQVYPQVAGYTDRAREIYYLFTAIDFVFPFVAGLFIASTAAFALRHAFPPWYESLTARKLLPLFMLGSAFDWLENLSILATLGLYPAELAWLPGFIVFAKRCKLALIIAAQGITVLLLLAALVRWLDRRLRGRSQAPHG